MRTAKAIFGKGAWGLVAVDGNIKQIMDAITQNLVDYVNLDDDDQIHYKNAWELDLLQDTVADTVEYMLEAYHGKFDNLLAYIHNDLAENFDVPSFLMDCVDMEKLKLKYNFDKNYTFINGCLYIDLN